MKRISLQGTSVDSLIIAIVKIVTLFTSLGSTMILSRKLSLVIYGTYSQSNVVISVAVALSILGMSDAMNYFYNNKKEKEQESYVNTILLIEIVIGLLMGFIILINSNFIIKYFNNLLLSSLFIYLAFRPLLENVINTLQILHLSIGHAKILASSNFIFALCKIIFVIISTYLTGNIKVIFIGQLILEFITLIYYYINFSKNAFKIQFSNINIKWIPNIFKFSIPMSIYTLTKILLKQTDLLIIGKYETTEQYAIYSNASYVLPFDIICNAFLIVMLPILTLYIAQKRNEEAAKLYSLYLRMGYITTITFSLTVLILSKECILFLFSEKYLKGIYVFMIYIFVDMIRFANISLVLSAKGWTKKLMYISLISVFVNYGLNYLLYFTIGFVGPAIATVITTLGTTIILCIFSAKAIDTKFIKLININEMLILIIQYFVIGVICLFIRNIMRYTNIYYLIILITIAIIFIGSIFVLNKNRIIKILKDINNLKK